MCDKTKNAEAFVQVSFGLKPLTIHLYFIGSLTAEVLGQWFDKQMKYILVYDMNALNDPLKTDLISNFLTYTKFNVCY